MKTPTPGKKSQPGYQMLINRDTVRRLVQDGREHLSQGLHDLNRARQLALWCNRSGAELYLLALLSAATRLTANHYFAQAGLLALPDHIEIDGEKHHLPELPRAYHDFLTCYPRAELQAAQSPSESAPSVQAKQAVVGELFLLEVLTDNPAAEEFRELFDDTELLQRLDYHLFLSKVDAYLQKAPSQPAMTGGLIRLLKEPVRAAPDNLAGQAAFVMTHWGSWLPEELTAKLKVARATSIEEAQQRLPGPGPTPVPAFGQDDGSASPAAFTDDTDWMSSAVLLAKSIYVWLDQLSSRYRRAITTLDSIPDEELALLAGAGFNALWLIGIWERSSASRKIKQLSGNPEAEASAYALHAYRVAAELGGEEGLNNLESRCRQHGIRLACDIVPNHTGIDSEWALQHPDWFIQSDHPPYPAYRFSGPDLCEVEGISIRIEDGYWDHSDAAVVCEYHDHHSGRRRYIYHGNDGTHMPWNDTAQLNFLLPEVRQAMSDLIVGIAKRFSLIRFDAAMTLARKHFRRLWFPPPGGSAGVPSRSAFCLSDEEFAQAFPAEFWRDVVDRINQEAPDTLLIAEAFWLMESYFVRTLGMHRVYNSAFMNLLKLEENAKYRQILKDILAYNPEILKRYVNFMNNPDEATAVEQFGKGDKYFGVATLLATLPGLPMFGHGQVEGYREKYGMEYRRAYWDEAPDEGFIAHHQQQVFPLLRMRHHFAGVAHFSLFDFTTAHGIDDNVFVFCNGPTGHKIVVIYNNSMQSTHGRIHTAAAQARADREGVAHAMPALAVELGLDTGPNRFCRFRSLQGLEYLYQADQLVDGLELHLNGYQHLVFSDFYTFTDEDGTWRALHNRLQGQPVANLDRERLHLKYAHLWSAFAKLLNPARLQVLAGGLSAPPQPAPVKTLLTELRNELEAVAEELGAAGNLQSPLAANNEFLPILDELPFWLGSWTQAGMPEQLLTDTWHGTRKASGAGVPVLAWILMRALGEQIGLCNSVQCLDFLSRFGLDHGWYESALTVDETRDIDLALLLMRTPAASHPATDGAAFTHLCYDPDNAGLLGINQHGNDLWFIRERMTSFAGTLALHAAIGLRGRAKPGQDRDTLTHIAETLRRRLARAAAVGYRLDKFLQLG